MIKFYSASADTTITNALKADLLTRGTGSNMGAADVLEVFSLFGQGSGSSDELSRVLIQFPIDNISSDRSAGRLPASGSVDFFLRLYNAPHKTTLPNNFRLEARPLIQSWQEGRGLDMEEYSDETLELEGSNWVYASSGSKWQDFGGGTRLGGSFKDNEINGGDTDNGNDGERVYTQYFTDGTEDLEIKITEAVEEWVAEAKATASLTALSKTSGQANTRNITITDAEGTAVQFIIDNSLSTSTATRIAFANANSNANQFAANIAAAINASSLRITATASSATVNLTMDIAGIAGNSVANIAGTAVTDSVINVGSQFSGGAGHTNYGFIIKLSGTHEAFNNADPSGMSLNNLTGSEDSFYTKRFFARSSQYFYRRPRIEARWDDSIKDDTSNFFVSSALAPELDNVNTIYMYNYVRGQLQNIPSIGDSDIYVALHTGSSRENLDEVPCEIKHFTPNDGTTQDLKTYATGGYVSTGIYSASVVVTSSLGSNNFYFPVWGSKDGAGSAAIFTGSAIDAKLFDTRQGNPSPTYVNSITNLKPSYFHQEKARLRLFVRESDWCPTIYTIAQKEQRDLKIIEDSYYKVFRVKDEMDVIPYGTGSSDSPQALGNNESFTRLSFDVSGSYLDLDMSLLEPGYSYGIKFVHYTNGDWREQHEVFKFRVEE